MQHDRAGVERERDEQRRHVDRRRVEHDDHEQRDEVVDDSDREQERTQAIGEARPDEREQAECERGVRRHRDAPAVRGGAAGVDREIDRDRGGCAAEAREHGQREAPAIAQLAEVELATSLEADDEEEERHQAAVDPPPEVERDVRVPDCDREARRPDACIRVRVDVHPEERGECRREQ